MPANEIFIPFPVVPDIDGEPLEAGYVYIGTSGADPEVSPITVYWDEALTIPAAQPIRTIAGYFARSGSPGRLYVNANAFSLTVRNKNGSLVFSNTNVDRAIPYADITGIGGDNLVTVETIADLLVASIGEDLVYVQKYRSSKVAGGAYYYKTGGSAAVPTFGTPVTGYATSGKIGGVGDGTSTYTGQSLQADFLYDTNGVEWRRSNLNQPNNVYMTGANGNDSTNDTGHFQDMLDSLSEGDCLQLPPGTFVLNATSTTGNAHVLANTGVTPDQPDFICCYLVGKKNIKIKGNNTVIKHDRGYAFHLLLCENITIEGIRFETINGNDLTGGFVPPDANYEPSSVLTCYSAHCHVKDCFIFEEYRGIRFERTTGCSAVGNMVSTFGYMGIASYGDLFQPGGWTPTNLVDYFTIDCKLTDAGILYDSNLLKNGSFFGLYSNGPALITNNRVETFKLFQSGNAGIQIAGGKCLVKGNRVHTENNSDLQDGTVGYAGINIKFEDVADGSQTDQIQVVENTIFGGSVGLFISEVKNLLVLGNHISDYTQSAINMIFSDALASNITDTVVRGNFIGAVDPDTTVATATYALVGGIVSSTQGSSFTATNIYIQDNFFNRQVASIVDATARTNHENDINVGALSGSRMSCLPNYFAGTGGRVITVNNSIYAGRLVDQLTAELSADGDVPELPGLEEIVILCTPSANMTLDFPEHLPLGQKITIINKSDYNITLNRFGAGYNFHGHSTMNLDNTAGTAGKAFSAVTLIVTVASISSLAYSTSMVHCSELYGGTVVYS